MLHEINLLPWREQQKKEHRQRFFGLLILGLIVAGVIQWGGSLYIAEIKQDQWQRNSELQNYIDQLDLKLVNLKEVETKHASILTRLRLVESLQNERNKTTEFMNLLPEWIPEGVYLDKVKMHERQVEISGISDSTSRLATMLNNLEGSQWLTDVEMHSIISGKVVFGKKFQTFKVSFVFNHFSGDQNHLTTATVAQKQGDQ